MRLFAIMVNIDRTALHVLARNFVEDFLSQQFSPRVADQYLRLFTQYASEYKVRENQQEGKRISSLSVKILLICEQIVKELPTAQRFMILLSLIRFAKYFQGHSMGGYGFSNSLDDAVRTIAKGLLISDEEFENCQRFIGDKFYNVPQKNRLLIISDNAAFLEGEVKHLQKERFPGQLIILKIQRAGIYLFQYHGKARLEISGKYIFPRHLYVFPKGGAIRGEGFHALYYSELVAGFMTSDSIPVLQYEARGLSYRFKDSSQGIRPMDFSTRSGKLVGIIGGSGAGKSTLLKLLSGSLSPASGDIFINGIALGEKHREMEGIIGLIPQDDLLIEDLSIFQNLYYNARLCMRDQGPTETTRKVLRLLRDLDLEGAKDLKVGSPLNKFISGGQRKRLNIALELIREPQVLLVDEPTSGLSSFDSENVMTLLKEQALQGRLVLSTIHQPSSELFRLFDQMLVLDQGGCLVYSGDPLEGITHFKKLAGRADAGENECAICGNTKPDEILNIIEAREVDAYGGFTDTRTTSPEEWYTLYNENNERKEDEAPAETPVSVKEYKPSGRFRQFAIFFRRNALAKLADRQFMAIALLVSPLLAIILGFFSKYVAGDESDPRKYIFSLNENLPAYLFMVVIVALFLGLIIAAEEIIKDRRILEREAFLKLNRSAYLLSKIAFLFILSGIQMLMLVLLGNYIMEIRGMSFQYWIVLFSTACFANLLGLNISDGLKSVVAIYVIVPFLLVPQILLAGVIVKFDKLHYSFASQNVVPVAGDLMASRWAYEALAVTQFTGNRYQAPLMGYEKLESNISYEVQYLVPALEQQIEDAVHLVTREESEKELAAKLRLITNGFGSIRLISPYEGTGDFMLDRFNPAMAGEAGLWLEKYRHALRVEREKVVLKRDYLIDSLKIEAGGAEAYLQIKRNYYNDMLANMVLNRAELHKLILRNDAFLRKMDPVFMPPPSSIGRSHFYSSEKKLGQLVFSTLTFNILILWFMNLVLYVCLEFSILKRFLEWMEIIRRKPLQRKA